MALHWRPPKTRFSTRHLTASPGRIDNLLQSIAPRIAEDGDPVDDESRRRRKAERIAERDMGFHDLGDFVAVAELGQAALFETKPARHVERAQPVGRAALRIDFAVKIVELGRGAELGDGKLDAARRNR